MRKLREFIIDKYVLGLNDWFEWSCSKGIKYYRTIPTFHIHSANIVVAGIRTFNDG